MNSDKIVYTKEQINQQKKKDRAAKNTLKALSVFAMPVHIALSPITYFVHYALDSKYGDLTEFRWDHPFGKFMMEPFSGRRIDQYIDAKPTSAATMEYVNDTPRREAVEEMIRKNEEEQIARRKQEKEQKKKQEERIAQLTTKDVLETRKLINGAASYKTIGANNIGVEAVLSNDIKISFIRGNAEGLTTVPVHNMYKIACNKMIITTADNRRIELNSEQVALVLSNIEELNKRYAALIYAEQEKKKEAERIAAKNTPMMQALIAHIDRCDKMKAVKEPNKYPTIYFGTNCKIELHQVSCGNNMKIPGTNYWAANARALVRTLYTQQLEGGGTETKSHEIPMDLDWDDLKHYVCPALARLNAREVQKISDTFVAALQENQKQA